MAGGLFGGGDGTAASPFIIEDALDLDAVRLNTAVQYQLKSDIDLNIAPFNTGEGWTPIAGFTGKLDGEGHLIKNLFINKPTVDYIGLFAQTNNGGIIQDVFLKNVNITGRNYVGAMAGQVNVNAAIQGVYRCGSSGVVKGNTYTGGLVGYLYGLLGNVQNSYSKCTVEAPGDFVGGLIGRTYGTNSTAANYLRVTNCLAYGAINSAHANANCTISQPYYTSVSQVYFLSSLGKPGNGTGVELETLKILDVTYPSFNSYFQGSLVWHFRPWTDPKLSYQVIPYEVEPVVLLNNNGSHFTYADASWVDLGADINAIDVYAQGIPWDDLDDTEWWGYFTGTVDILLFSKTEDPLMDMIIIENFTTDVETVSQTVEVDSFSAEAVLLENNKDLYLISESKQDLELQGASVEVDSMSPKLMQHDGNYEVLMEANDGADLSLENEIASLDIDSNSTEPMTLEDNYSVTMEGVDATDATTDASFEVEIDSALDEVMSLDDSYEVLMEGIEATDATASAEFFVDVDSSETEPMKLDEEYDVLLEGLNTADNEATDGVLAVDSQELDDTASSQELDVYGEATSQVRSVISINNGREWWTFDVEADNWKQTELKNIDIEGMSIDVLNSLDYFDYEKLVPNKIYTKDLIIATQASSTLDDAETIFRSLEVEYFENQPAFVSNVRLTPDNIHNEYAELRFDVVDLEGDDVFYKVLVKRADEVGYTQIEPDPSVREWNQRPAEASVYHAYNHPYFNTGLNKVQVVVKDSRGLESAHEFDLYLMDEAPYVQLTSDKFGMDLVIGDDHLDSVSYKVTLNGESLIGYTDFQVSPVSFRYTWRPGQLKRDEPNVIRVDVVDSFGNMTVEEFQIDGQFTSLMFVDPSGQYLTDNLGQLLSYLDFGAIVGGTISLPKTVKVINETGSAVKNLNIKALNDHLPEGVSVQFSKELMPFEETDNIQYSGVVPFMDQREFHVRIKSDRRLSGIREFEAYAIADTEI